MTAVRVLLAATLLATALAAPAAAASHHRQAIDITFPAAPGARFADDYAAPRGTRVHRATDVFAARGSHVYAAVGGSITWMPATPHATAGYSLHIRGSDGRLYAYYHLGPARGPAAQAYAPGLRVGATVRRGQHIGYLGDSGNAAGGSPHLHFEIHDDAIRDPYGGNRRNPYASLLAAVRRGDYAVRGAAATSRSASNLLRSGARGSAVAEWQRQLNRAIGAGLAVDGAFGPRTDGATRSFQRAQGLAVDGIVGPQTRAAMQRVLGVTTVLRSGARGQAVRDWQAQLNRVGFGIAVDGVFGRQTDQATRGFQRARGLTADGIVGPRTRAAMASALG